MVMNVGNVSPLLFKSNKSVDKPDNKKNETQEIKELANVTPDFYVKTPIPYKKTGTEKLPNGLEIHTYKLANGYRVSIVPMQDSPAVVKNYVNVGSMNETDDIKGISHFLEHMAFNGTEGNDGYIKLEQGDSFSKVDEMGGWTNASTNYAITDYVNSTPLLDEKDLETQIKIIAAMTENLTLSDKMIEKEKFPVSSEIDMILDKPETIVVDQTLRTLFNIKSSADELVGGSVKHIQSLTRKDVLDYYNKYYVPENMNLVITGDVDPDKTIELVSKNFRSTKERQGNVYETKLTPINSTVRKDFISDKATSASVMLGFAGPKSSDARGQILYNIACKYLESSDVNLRNSLLELNAAPEIGIEKISTNPNSPSLIYYTFNCADENAEKALKIFYNKLNRIESIKPHELDRIKESLLILRDNVFNKSINVNTLVGQAVLDGNLDFITRFDEILEDIKPEEVDRFIKQYFDLNKAAITLVHPQKQNNISFKGASRKPIDMEKVSVVTLDNNINTTFYETKSSTPQFNINFYYETPANLKPGTKELLDIVLGMGTENLNEKEFKKYTEKNNLKNYIGLEEEKLILKCSSSYSNFEKNIQLAKEQLYNPAFTESNLIKAKNLLKDSLERAPKTADELYLDNESKTNPLYSSRDAILENLDNVNLEDLEHFYAYILKNSYATISMSIPHGDSKLKDIALSQFKTLKDVQQNTHKVQNVYSENNQVQVLTEAVPYSQADISETFKYKRTDSPKEFAVSNIMNILLSSSKTIGLFNNLREKEHLAYSVYSSLDKSGNSGELSLHILTTTDNKDSGEVRYENLKKAINGFNRQIEALKNSEYTDIDLESAKKTLKAELLNKETPSSKLNALDRGLRSQFGVDLDNQIFKAIDAVTREDIQNFVQKVFKNPPIYSIVASENTLNANKTFLENLKDID